MKNTQAESEAHERMKPGSITAQGFLGSDTRSIADIVQSDMEAFRRSGIDNEQAAAFLERLRDAGQKGLGEPTGVDGKYVVTVGDARGLLPCPFQDGTFHKNSIEAVDERSGARIVYSDLSIHLLRVHRFCQGTGSVFRLDPAAVAGMMA
jgi:hypothetical protein